MSFTRSLMVSSTLSFGLTYLLTAGTAGAMAASFYGLFIAGIVAAGVLAAYDPPQRWYPSRRSFYSYYDDYVPSFFSSFYMPRARRSSMSLYGTTPAPIYPSSGVPATAHHVERTFVPDPARAPTPPPSFAGNAHLVSSGFVPTGASHGGYSVPPSAPSAVPATAQHKERTFVPAPTRTPAPPPASASNAHHVSSQYVPLGAPARSYTPLASSPASGGGTQHVGQSFRPTNVPPPPAPSAGAHHVSRQFVPRK